MSKYTEETLDKLLKKDLLSIVLSQHTEMDAANSETMDQIHKFNENFEKLQSELLLSKEILCSLKGWSPWNVSAGQMPSTLDVSV